jgi:transcriptional regulator with XRE-family HTH domain
MKDREPTIRSRTLGDGLRQAMKYAGFNAAEMAHQLGWSPSRVSRILSGKRGGSSVDVATFLAVCGIRGTERDRLMTLTLDQNDPGWLQNHGSRLPTQLLTLIDHETKAHKISEFEFNLIPGLLQSDGYIRALLEEAGRVPSEEIGGRVAAKLGRQNMLSRRNAPTFVFYMHEFALRLPVGGSVVMSEQLHKLLQMSVRSNVRLRVVPASVGAHAATAGSFRLMEFRQIKPIVYLDSETSSLFLERPIEIDAYRSILAALDATALQEGQSREFIADMAMELYSDREAHDHLAEE